MNNSPVFAILLIIYWSIRILQTIIFVDAILSWIPQVASRYYPVVRTIRGITEPIYRPIRTIIPPEKTGYLDLSPLIAIFALSIIGNVIGSMF